METNVDYLITGPDDATTSVVLAHGAGAGMDTPFMEAFADGFAEARIRTVRFEFPYMVKRRVTGKKSPPDRAGVLIDSFMKVIEFAGSQSKVVVGGKSMGGRYATMVADDSEAIGVVCLGYPFHPPGKPEKLRTEHLERMSTPTLILQGERDGFGTAEEVNGYTLSDAISVVYLKDGDHSFKPRKASGRTLDENLKQSISEAVRFIKSL